MRLVGSYRVEPGKVVTCHKNGKDYDPYLFIHRAVTQVGSSTEFTLAPSRHEQAHIMDQIIPLDAEDGLFLWFCVASHPRQRIQRNLLRNCTCINTAEWGSTAILIAPVQVTSTVVFHHRGMTETIMLENGKEHSIVEQKEMI